MPYDERNDESRFEEKYPDSAFIDAVEIHEPAGTRDVADRVGCSINLARKRLKQLAERGELVKQQAGRRFIFTVS